MTEVIKDIAEQITQKSDLEQLEDAMDRELDRLDRLTDRRSVMLSDGITNDSGIDMAGALKELQSEQIEVVKALHKKLLDAAKK